MMKKSLLKGLSSAWGATSTWTYSSTLADNTFGSAFSGSTSGIVSVTLGATSESEKWQIFSAGTTPTPRGLYHTNATATLTDGIPTAGTFMKIEASQDAAFTPKFYRQGKGYLRMVDATDTETYIFNVRYGGSDTSYPTAKLTSGHTYYLWFAYDSGYTCNFAISGFTAATYTTYTINYTYDGTTIKSESDVEAYEGQTVTASYTSMWDEESTTKYYVADDATTSFTVADGTNTFEVALRLAATDAVATVNAVDGDGTVLATFTGGSGIEGEAYDGYVYYTRAVLYNGKYYAVAAANGNGYNYGKNGLVFGTPGTVTYILDEAITYYAEAEDLQVSGSYAASGTVPERASGGDWKRLAKASYAYTKSGDLPAGVYTLEVSGRNQGSKSAAELTIEVLNSNKTIYSTIGTLSWATSTNTVNTQNYILVPSNCSVAIHNTDEYNSNLCLDYIILRKLYDVTDADNIIGAVDYSSTFNTVFGEEMSIPHGKTMKISFTNHGSGENIWNGFNLMLSENDTEFTALTSAWGNTYDTTDTTVGTWPTRYQVSYDGGSSYGWIDWENQTMATDLKDAVVEMTISNDNGTITVNSITTHGTNVYASGWTISGKTGKITAKLSVDCAWLEVLSQGYVITKTLPDFGYATFSNSVAVAVPEGITVYTGVAQEGSIKLTAVEGATVIPANTGVMIAGTPDADYDFIPTSETSDYDWSSNEFIPTSVEAKQTVTEEGYYGLSATELKFIKVGTGVTFSANKAYIKGYAASEAKALGVTFGDDATVIENIEVTATGNSAVYNLSGQKVDGNYKGIIIKNGKKYLNK